MAGKRPGSALARLQHAVKCFSGDSHQKLHLAPGIKGRRGTFLAPHSGRRPLQMEDLFLSLVNLNDGLHVTRPCGSVAFENSFPLSPQTLLWVAGCLGGWLAGWVGDRRGSVTPPLPLRRPTLTSPCCQHYLRRPLSRRRLNSAAWC